MNTFNDSIPASGRLLFTALRNGSKLGTHSVTFHRDGDSLTTDIAIDYAVKLGFITVFRYTLRGRESWSGGILTAARADTDNNGTPEFMRARRDGDGLLIEGSQTKPYRAPPGSLIATHWNKAQLGAAMINPQDGSLLRFTVKERGPARVADSAGRHHTADGFTLSGPADLDLWYGTDGLWRSLRAKAADKSVISYLQAA